MARIRNPLTTGGHLDRREFVLLALSGLQATGCCGPKIGGSTEMLSILSKASEREGLAIALLGTDICYTEYFFGPAERIDFEIPQQLTRGRPTLLTNWGQTLVVQRGSLLEVVNLDGHMLGTFQRTVDLDGCSFQRDSHVLFWGRQHKAAQYGFYLINLNDGLLSTIYEFDLLPGSPTPHTSASFQGGHGALVRISVGFESYLLESGSKQVSIPHLQMEFVEASPDGKRLAGRVRNGKLGFARADDTSPVEIDVRPIGRCKWDPSSRYVLCVQRTQALGWCAQSELVIADTVNRDILKLPAIVPDERDHPYEWILRSPKR
jgi:hypothetical protein